MIVFFVNRTFFKDEHNRFVLMRLNYQLRQIKIHF